MAPNPETVGSHHCDLLSPLFPFLLLFCHLSPFLPPSPLPSSPLFPLSFPSSPLFPSSLPSSPLPFLPLASPFPSRSSHCGTDHQSCCWVHNTTLPQSISGVLAASLLKWSDINIRYSWAKIRLCILIASSIFQAPSSQMSVSLASFPGWNGPGNEAVRLTCDMNI